MKQRKFDRNGITIPFPQVTLSTREEPGDEDPVEKEEAGEESEIG